MFKQSKHFLCGPPTSLLGISPREMNTHVYTKTCLQMFLAPPFIIVKNWIYPQVPINWCIDKQVVEFGYNGMLSAFIKEQIINSHNMDTSQNHFTKWRRKPNTKHWMIPLIWNLGKGKTIMTEKKQWFPGAGSRVRILTTKGHKGTLWSAKNILYPAWSGVLQGHIFHKYY